MLHSIVLSYHDLEHSFSSAQQVITEFLHIIQYYMIFDHG